MKIAKLASGRRLEWGGLMTAAILCIALTVGCGVGLASQGMPDQAKNGEWIVYSCPTTGGFDYSFGTCIIRPDGTGKSEWSKSDHSNAPVWIGRDGQSLYETEDSYDLMDRDGSIRATLPKGNSDEGMRVLAVSPDGSKFVTASGSGRDISIQLVGVDGQAKTELAVQPCGGCRAPYATFSPDGSKIAFVTQTPNEVEPGFEAKLTVHDLKSGKDFYVPGGLGWDDDRGFDWSPNGKQLAYLNPFELRVMDADGSNDHALRSADGLRVAWSPDGERLAIIDDNALEVMHPNGNVIQKLADNANDMVWAPDSQRIVYGNEDDDGKSFIYLLNLDGPVEKQLGEGANPMWLPTPK